MRALFLFLFVPFIFIAGSAAASDYKWIGQITEDGASLMYAIPESDGVLLDFHCDRKTKLIVVNFEHEPKEAKDGMQVAVRFSVRGLEANTAISIQMKGERLELDDKFLFQGETRMTSQLRRILAEGGTLLVTVANRAAEIPLKGVALAARQLLASCP